MEAPFLQEISRSNAMDERNRLPTFPAFNNPWIYMAYVALIAKCVGEARAFEYIFAKDLGVFLHDCETEPGLYDRWPDGGGGKTSHDELMGIAYLDPTAAFKILTYLKVNDGYYENKKMFDSRMYGETRFVFLVPFLKACASRMDPSLKPNLFDRIMFSIHLIVSAYQEPDFSGVLKTWLMLDRMDNFFMCRFFGNFWKKRMTKKGVPGPKTCFKVYLAEFQALQKYAPETF